MSKDLTVAYRQGNTWLEAVRDVNLQIYPGQTYGLVGESGSGKTTLALSIMRYLGTDGRVVKGAISLGGDDLCARTPKEMTQVWGSKLTMVPQNPISSLNPAIRIGEQLAETLRHHQGLSGPQADLRAIELLEMVHLADPARVAESYPHQLSGGMQQRIMIAIALSTEPLLLVLDEPTTSLDVTTQAVVLDLIRELIQGRQTAALYVTHNLGVVARLCDRVSVLYAGELVEDAPTHDLFHKPLHPYTKGLLDSVPRLGETKGEVQLRAIQGRIPALNERTTGCIFTPRCPLAIEICETRPPLFQATGSQMVRCHRWEEIASGEINSRQPYPASPGGSAQNNGAEPALKISNVEVAFPLRRSLPEVLARRPRRTVRAVNGVNLTIPEGVTLGLVGESGSGKTTLARAIMGLVETTSGEMQLLSVPLPSGLGGRGLEILRHLQIVFQNPEEALNPYLPIGESLRRPLRNLVGMTRREAEEEVTRLLRAVGLPADYAQRLPGQLSGGEKQRVAIARAFASSPALLVFDEPVSSLDVSVQASILNLLNELQAEANTSQLFISHNLAVVGFVADQIAVIYLGQLMETACG